MSGRYLLDTNADDKVFARLLARAFGPTDNKSEIRNTTQIQMTETKTIQPCGSFLFNSTPFL
ncbi:MAG: hypothetical protein NT166_23895 [Candidatus Aminicenantes bacterium]|nr:hypothetical protein [Candidatus Aminicenantes bacterium]